jgi:hypothetical protein
MTGRGWLLALVLVLACGGRSPNTKPDPQSGAMLQVQNQGFTDMVIYAVRSAQRIRLGLATGNSTRSFTIPNYLLRGAGPLRFLADPIGGNRAPVTEEFSVQPGDLVTLTIPP